MTMTAANPFNELSNIINNTLSIEVRVETSEINNLIKSMEDLGFKSKNSWASMQLPNHTVLEFWKKELIKR